MGSSCSCLSPVAVATVPGTPQPVPRRRNIDELVAETRAWLDELQIRHDSVMDQFRRLTPAPGTPESQITLRVRRTLARTIQNYRRMIAACTARLAQLDSQNLAQALGVQGAELADIEATIATLAEEAAAAPAAAPTLDAGDVPGTVQAQDNGDS